MYVSTPHTAEQLLKHLSGSSSRAGVVLVLSPGTSVSEMDIPSTKAIVEGNGNDGRVFPFVEGVELESVRRLSVGMEGWSVETYDGVAGLTEEVVARESKFEVSDSCGLTGPNIIT